MLSIQEVVEQTRNALQMLIDRMGLNLAVGPLKESDYRLLSSGMFGELNWEWGISKYTGQENSVDLCFKILSVKEEYPAGIALCAYRTDTQAFEIYMIENFVRDQDGHPLCKRMALFTFMGAFIFTDAVEGSHIIIDEPDEALRDYYSQFGFEDDPGCSYRMSCTLETLRAIITNPEKWV
ncbi:hypothetical protein SENE111051_13585 [Serratia nematodiphila]|uniref:GNAT family N-acetyltransferase n=2 Tax=Serratia TaxID=613 RepID=A0A1G5KHI5_9GAMM|nr:MULTISPECIES: hypothetical protein [Serratia]KFF88493.1 hypothetical protein JL05_10460 [Serratia nematodiphila DZ0503SBS1]MBH1918630.1 hypothetical protein [Serratia surfactantfaciens]SCY99530.1 hypothetical protein SAMN02927935_03382 [Serratia nematodiphila]